MKGTMLIISPSGGIKTVPLSKPPEVDTLQEEVGGWIEQISGFLSVDYRGTVYPCVAFGNEEAKLPHQNLRPNDAATRMWAAALQRRGLDLARAGDFLAGKIIVIFGDQELMKAL
jgi:hypothetical protein